jgi:DNA-binding transcriptional regulator YhcF (GntR family)
VNEENKKYGYIELWRSLLSWGWWQEPNTAHLFVHCLLRASVKDDVWKGIIVKRGQFITSISKLATETGLTEKQVRTALEHLIKTGEVAKSTTSKFSIISVKNYDNYQAKGKQRADEKADKGQAKGKQRATDNNNNTKRDILPKGNISLGEKEKNLPDVAVPGGTPQANKKPSFKEMREFYIQSVGRDDAVLVDDFDRECRKANNYSNWKQRLLKYRGDTGC